MSAITEARERPVALNEEVDDETTLPALALNPSAPLWSDQELQRRLDLLRAAVDREMRGERKDNALALMQDWKPQIVGGQMRIVSPSLLSRGGMKWTPKHRFLLHHLVKIAERLGSPGQRFTLSKRRFEDYLELRPYAAPTETLVDADLSRLRSRLEAAQPIKRVVFTHHSGKSVSSTIRWLMNAGVEVDLYVVDPAIACCEDQAGKIRYEARDVRGFYRDATAGRVRVFFQRVPASVRGMVAENPDGEAVLVAVGHYYYFKTRSNKRSPLETQIVGHVLPTTIAERGSPEFDVLYRHLMEPYINDLETHRGRPAQEWIGRPRGKRPKPSRVSGKTRRHSRQN